MRASKYSSGGYRPQGSRTKSKDNRGDNLKSNNLLKKGSWNNTIVGTNKGFGQSPAKKPKPIEANVAKITHSDSEPPNYVKPIHNSKKKGKQDVIGIFSI